MAGVEWVARMPPMAALLLPWPGAGELVEHQRLDARLRRGTRPPAVPTLPAPTMMTSKVSVLITGLPRARLSHA